MNQGLRAIERHALHRWIIVVGFSVVLVVAGVAVFTHEPQEQFCTLEGRIQPNGEIYGRDPSQGCQFVDADGNVSP